MRKFALTMIALALGMLALTPTVALAHHADDHEQGPPDRQEAEESEVTEDDDDDGVDNCPDPEGDADNQHPSGHDKHCESGRSGNQGNAQHDPDDDGNGPDRSNGGLDQPGGEGGEDELDQDGNNGCGNDDDFEDDNEGWCGKPDRQDEATQGAAPDRSEQPERSELPEQRDQPEPVSGDDAQVAGITEDREVEPVAADATPTIDDAEVPGEAAVLGIRFERDADTAVAGAGDSTSVAPTALARTGIPAALLGLAGIGLLTAGFGLRRRG